MLARLGVEILLFIFVFFLIFLLFERLLRSKRLNKLIKGAFPPPDTDDEVLAAYDAADLAAEEQAQAAEQQAVAKINSAAKLKGRRRTPQS